MNTSNFAKSKKFIDKNLVSISLYPPKWYNGRVYKDLAPNWDTIDAWKKSSKTEKDWENYKRDYFKSKLNKLDPKKVFEDLGDDAILLCFEKDGEPGHRHLVADWLTSNLNIKITEI